jgi:hypothetical protein
MNEVQKLVTEIASSAALMESEFLNKYVLGNADLLPTTNWLIEFYR